MNMVVVRCRLVEFSSVADLGRLLRLGGVVASLSKSR